MIRIDIDLVLMEFQVISGYIDQDDWFFWQ